MTNQESAHANNGVDVGAGPPSSGPAAIHWAADANGYFGAGANWVGGATPGPADNAVLDAPGATPYTVTASGSYTVNGVDLASTATLLVTGGTFTASKGTAGGDNAGVLEASGGGELGLMGVVNNTGTILGNGSGGVSLQGVVNNAGGTILAAGYGVSMHGGDIVGGTLVGYAYQITVSGAGNRLDGTASPVVIANSVTNVGVDSGSGAPASLTLMGAIANSGNISVVANQHTSAKLIIGAAGVTLSGGGSVGLDSRYGGVAEIQGAVLGATLTNFNNTIEGIGQLGAGKLTLVNDAGGTIEGGGEATLTINTGVATITNAGLMETATEALIIKSVVNNSGTIEANGGTLTLDAAVSGSGAVTIAAGTLDIANAGAMENVAFTGKTGKLELAHSQTYTGSVKGFSLTGQTSLDLRDIVFTSGVTRASYSSGILTVTDGAHTAHITLIGNYTASTFTVSSDGHAGTTVVDPPKAAGVGAAPTPHAFIAAMAGLGACEAMAIHTAETWRVQASTLAGPRVSVA